MGDDIFKEVERLANSDAQPSLSYFEMGGGLMVLMKLHPDLPEQVMDTLVRVSACLISRHAALVDSDVQAVMEICNRPAKS
ncbi:MAG: hypothetical protein JWP93_2331 [Polaromonas sp.]|nr:hypothetical protein [Polaromonas sp.]